jgi:predicted dehydrogenase
VLRFGLAGLGIHGQRYARHLLRGDVAGARLTAVCRRDAPRGREFAREHGLHFAATPEELAQHAGVDAVVLVLPAELHPAAASACLRAGKAVFVEKPLARDSAAARGLALEAASTGTPLMVGQTLRLDAVVRELRRRAGGLGPLRVISINQRFEPSDRPWIDTPGSGGVILNTGVHGFDLLRHLTGLEAAWVVAEATRSRTVRTEDQFAALVRLEPGGVLGVVENARTTRARSGRIELVSETAQLWGDHIHRTLHEVRDLGVTDLGPVPASPTVPLALDRFTRAVREGRTPEITAADGVAALELVDAARLSVERGRRVWIEEVRGAAPTGAS